jgi:hypothetical protein
MPLVGNIRYFILCPRSRLPRSLNSDKNELWLKRKHGSKGEAEQVRERLEFGEDFGKLARELSQDEKV